MTDQGPAANTSPITIVIASKNRPENIAVALASIALQSLAPARTIIVDQSAIRYTLRADPALMHLYDPNLLGLTAARNAALPFVETPYVFFIDDDVELAPRSLQIIVAAFEREPRAIGVQAPDAMPHEYGRLSKFIQPLFSRGFFNREPFVHENVAQLRWLAGFAMAFRTKLFASERFDEWLTGYGLGEDWEFSQRARRYGILIEAKDAAVFHHSSPVKRHALPKILRNNWVNMLYFFDKLDAGRIPLNHLWKLLWMCGEAYRWLREGLGLPFFDKELARMPRGKQ